MSNKLIVLIVLPMVFALTFIGCSKKSSQSANTGTTENGPEIIPFPIDVPIYEYSDKIEKKVGKMVARATFITSSDVDVIIDYYKGILEKHGWTKIGTAEDPENVGLIFKKAKRVLSVIIKQDLDTEFTHVTLIVKG